MNIVGAATKEQAYTDTLKGLVSSTLSMDPYSIEGLTD